MNVEMAAETTTLHDGDAFIYDDNTMAMLNNDQHQILKHVCLN